jgi:hypothetical protein
VLGSSFLRAPRASITPITKRRGWNEFHNHSPGFMLPGCRQNESSSYSRVGSKTSLVLVLVLVGSNLHSSDSSVLRTRSAIMLTVEYNSPTKFPSL